MEVTEVIVYSIRKEHKERTEEILKELHQIVNAMEGLLSLETFKACNEPDTLMDFIRWDSMESVNAAKELFRSLPAYGKIAGYFEEMEYFKQFHKY